MSTIDELRALLDKPTDSSSTLGDIIELIVLVCVAVIEQDERLRKLEEEHERLYEH